MNGATTAPIEFWRTIQLAIEKDNWTACRSGGVPVPGLRLRSMGGDFVDSGVVRVQPAPVRGQHFQWAEALSLAAVDQL